MVCGPVWHLFGTCLTLIADPARCLLDQDLRAPAVSRISAQEMARINIEMSAALAELIAYRFDSPERYAHLVRAALRYPPKPAALPRGFAKYTQLMCAVLMAGFSDEWSSRMVPRR